LLDNQPARTVEEGMESLGPLEGHGLVKKEGRERLKADQRNTRNSHARKKGNAPP
jgi:hypothetical protein